MAQTAFNKEIWRSINHSWGRFIAIFGIVALGVGFYAGLRMTAPDMNLAADAFYDQTNLMDIRVVSTMGMTEEDMQALRDIPGVEAVMPAYETDAEGLIHGESYVFRIHSMNDGMKGSDQDEGESEAAGPQVNQLILADGRWPENPGECVVSADRIMSTPVQLGDKITLEEGLTDLADVLNVSEYTIVGTVHSSYYASSTSMGSSTLGSGLVQQFMFVPESDFSEDYPFTEAFILVKGAKGEISASGEYKSTVQQVEDKINAIVEEREQARLDGLKADAQAELDDARREYEESRAEAEGKLADAESELKDAAATIAQSERDIANGQAEYNDGVRKLQDERSEADRKFADAESEIAENQKKIEDSRAQLKDAEKELSDAAAVLESSREKLASGKKQLEEQEKALEAKRPEYEKAKELIAGYDQAVQQLAAVEAALAAAEQDPDFPPDQKAKLEAQKNQLTIAISQMQPMIEPAKAGIAQFEAGEKAIAEAQAQIRAGEQQLAEGEKQYASGKAKYDEGVRQLQDGEKQLADGQTELASQRQNVDEQFADAQKKLDDAAWEISDGQSQLASGKADYEDGLAEYNKARAEADEEFAKAEKELADAQADIDAIERPEWLVMDRSKNYGAESFKLDATRVDNIAAVFPFIFFLVAALVSLTTMTRMVDEERMVIGTYKALGYSRTRITSKYLIYAGTASLAGSVVGIAALSFTLPAIIMSAYSIVYIVPTANLALDWPIALGSAGLGVGITLVATWGAAMSTLRESPAALMLPRAPKAGKRILLERVKPLWSRMSFLWKVTARNIFRYKKRFVMTVVGIAGCTALLLTGFGLQDSINDIIDKHYGQVVKYTVVVTEEDDAPADARGQELQMLKNIGQSQAVATVQENSVVVTGKGGEGGSGNENGAGTAGNSSGESRNLTARLVVPDNLQDFSKVWALRERVSENPLEPSSDGAVITEKIANQFGVSVGDKVILAEQDSMGNATNDTHEVPVVGIAENYVGHAVIMTPGLYEEVYGEEPESQTIYSIISEDESIRDSFIEAVRSIDGVKTVEFNDETIDSYKSSLKSVNMIVVVLILAAAALAFIVLYNLTNINITERIREIATLKVLGFTPREVQQYIFRETIVLSIVGALVGLAFGIFLENFVVVTAEVNEVMFGREIHALSFVWSFLLTMAFTVLVMLVMRRKLAKVNMVESLKSNE